MNYIYKISNDINEKIYIGKTGRTVEDRFAEHIYNSTREDITHRPLYAAMNKYGTEHFFVEKIDECENDEEASEKEIYWITYYNSYQNGYNATLGGDGKAYLNLNENEIIEKHNKRFSNREIARQYNVSEKTIRNILKKYGIRNTQKLEDFAMIKDEKIIKIFNQITVANKYIHKKHNSTGISMVLSHKRQSAYGYEWKYVSEIVA